jgi:hypothetical protein
VEKPKGVWLSFNTEDMNGELIETPVSIHEYESRVPMVGEEVWLYDTDKTELCLFTIRKIRSRIMRSSWSPFEPVLNEVQAIVRPADEAAKRWLDRLAKQREEEADA